MFQGSPRRQFPSRYQHYRHIHHRHHRQSPKKPNILSQLYDSVGKLDVEKMKATAESLQQLYSEISPIFTKLNKK